METQQIIPVVTVKGRTVSDDQPIPLLARDNLKMLALFGRLNANANVTRVELPYIQNGVLVNNQPFVGVDPVMMTEMLGGLELTPEWNAWVTLKSVIKGAGNILTVALLNSHFVKEAGFQPQIREVQLPHLQELDDTLSVHRIISNGPDPEKDQAAIVYYRFTGRDETIAQYYFDPAKGIRLRNLGALPQLSEIYTAIRGPIWNPNFDDIAGEYIGWKLVDALQLNNNQ